MTIRLLAFAGALRAGSWNRKLLAVGVERARALGAEVDLLDLNDVTMPLYDGDLEERSGLPEGAVRFRQRIQAAGAMLIASPEYNNSIPGVLKNAIDWASRPPKPPFRDKVAGLLSTSIGSAGGARMLPDLRKVLSAVGVFVVPSQFALARGHEAFDEAGKLKAEAAAKEVDRVVSQLLRAAEQLGGDASRQPQKAP
jgi:chromate reductase, NAD(P)H dehydrogenase (quinone)